MLENSAKLDANLSFAAGAPVVMKRLKIVCTAKAHICRRISETFAIVDLAAENGVRKAEMKSEKRKLRNAHLLEAIKYALPRPHVSYTVDVGTCTIDSLLAKSEPARDATLSLRSLLLHLTVNLIYLPTSILARLIESGACI